MRHIVYGTVPSKSNLNKIADEYKKLQSVWKVGESLGLSGQHVHEVLSKSGLINKMNYFTDSDKELLKEKYIEYKKANKLALLAEKMGRTKHFICRKAKELGLTNRNYKPVADHVKRKLSNSTKERIKRDGHPKGMLGKKHSEETKAQYTINMKRLWADPNSSFNSEENRQKHSDYMTKWQSNRANKGNNYSRTKKGLVTIGGKEFFARSSWEANIAAYYQFLKENGEVLEWEHEPQTFWFLKIKRGVRSYLPDFMITANDNSKYFVEVKGWMDEKSKTKLNRMRIYYPEIKLEVIDSKRYKGIAKNKSLIKGWGILDSDEYLSSIVRCSLDGCDNKNHSKGYCRKHYYKIYKK